MKTLVLVLGLLALSGCARPEGETLRTVELAFAHDVMTTPEPEPTPGIRAPADGVDLNPDPAVIQFKFEAAPYDLEVDGQTVEGFAYNQQVPGPTLRGRVGDTLEVELTNSLDTATTIHWHGVHVPWAMDGATWETDPVEPGETFTYTYTLTHPGTYWYHPHFDTERQVDLGLYGMLLVEGPDEPKADAELVLVLDGWSESHASRDPAPEKLLLQSPSPPVTRWTVNGVVEPTFSFEGGQVIRVRMVNVSNGGFLRLLGPGLRQIASDQGFLGALQDREELLLAPGDRVELEWLVGEEGFTLLADPTTLHGGATGRDPFPVLHVVTEGGAPAPNGLAWPFVEGLPSADPAHTDLVYTFAGSGRTGEWLINGESFPEVTISELAHGTEAILEVRNLSPTDHPFHLHGYGFEVLSRNGVAPPWRQMEDTVNVAIRERLRVRLLADNPGQWMLHCHILPHADGGMMTVLRVLDPL